MTVQRRGLPAVPGSGCVHLRHVLGVMTVGRDQTAPDHSSPDVNRESARQPS